MRSMYTLSNAKWSHPVNALSAHFFGFEMEPAGHIAECALFGRFPMILFLDVDMGRP